MKAFVTGRLASFAFFCSLLLIVSSCKDEKVEQKPRTGYSINITSHQDSQYVNTPSIDIDGTFTIPEDVPQDSVEVRFKENSVSMLSGGRFEIPDVPLKMGKNKIHLKLLVGDEMKAQIDIWIIYSDYYLEIVSPFDGEVFRDETVNINGVYEYPQGIDPSELSIKIDSHLDATIRPDGTFSLESYQLKKGTHKLRAALYLKNKEKFRDINEVKFYQTNQTPKAKFFVNPMEGKSPMLVTIDGSESTDTDGHISRWLWDFGDGTQIETTTPILNHTFKWVLKGCNGETREHRITLQVIDNDGGISSTHKKNISLECEPNSPPAVGENQTEYGYEDNILNFSLNPATDVDGDPLTYHLVTGPSVGTINGCLDGSGSTNCEYIPMPNYFGVVSFTYKVNDGIYDSESSATVTINLAAVNDVPVMRGDQTLETNEDTPLEFTLLGAFDVDGDVLSYRLVDAPENAQLKDCIQNDTDLTCLLIPDENYFGEVVLTYIANDGQVDAEVAAVVVINVLPVNDAPVMVGDQSFDGLEDEALSFTLLGATDIENDSLVYRLVDSPTEGTLSNCLSNTNDLTCDFMPNENFNGVITFSYIANDGKLDAQNAATVTLNLAPVNDIPLLGENQSLETDEDSQLSFNLNTATDVDGDILNYRIISPIPAHSGTITGCGDSTTSTTCTFTPAENFNGVINFTYTVNDGQVDAVGVAQVDINVIAVNDAPVVGADQIFATSEDTPLNFRLSDASDIEGDPLNYIVVLSPMNGQLTGCGQGDDSQNCTFIPDRDFHGSVNFTYKVNDGQDDSQSVAKVTINIAPVNDAPVIADDQIIEGLEDVILDFKVNSASDVEDDELIYEIVDAPTVGVLSGCLDGTAALDCRYTAPENFFGSVEFTYRAFDGELYTETNGKITLNIASVNDAPLMPADQYFEVDEDNLLEFDLLAATDVEGAAMTYSLVDSSNDGVLSECLEGSADLRCIFSPTQDFFGEATFTYKANDGTDDSESVTTVTINVLPINDPPVTGEDQNFTINENTSLSFNVNSAFDVEGDSLTYKVIIPPSKGVLSGCMEDNAVLSCVYTPPEDFYGNIVIRYRANDGSDSTEKLGTINIEVLMVNSAPVMALHANFETDEDVALNFSVSAATDADNDSLTYRVTREPTVGTLSGCLEENAILDCTYTAPDNFNGLVTFSYIANDARLDAANETEVTIEVKPVNDPPFVGESQNFILDENSTLKFSMSSGGDLEDDELTYVLVSAPQNGQILGCLGSTTSTVCEYRPNEGFKGEDSLTYKVNDGVDDSINTATITFQVNAINYAPVLALSSAFEADEDTVLTLDLPAATDQNGDSLTYWINAPPENGKLENCLGGTSQLSCKFTPKKDFNGEVSFSYFAFDGALRSNNSHLVTISFRPVNDPPVLGDNQEFIFNEDEEITFQVNHATDVDTDDSLIFYSIVTPPSHGTLQNCFNFTNDLECKYVPNSHYHGEDEFTYVASDGSDFSLEVGRVLLNIRPVNDAPFFEKPQLAEAYSNQTTEFSITPAIDLDGDSLVYELVDPPTNATLSNCLNEESDLICDFTPDENFIGDVSFAIRAFDGIVYSDVQTVTVSVVTRPVYALQIDSNLRHSCAVMSNGDLYCWGYNYYGQLGYGNTYNVGDDELPTSVGKVSVGSKVKKVSLGRDFTCALLESNDVKCWGINNFGQLGQGNVITLGDNELPSSIPNIEIGAKVKDIEAGIFHTCVILESDDVKCWGKNLYGPLGLARTDYIGDNEKPIDVASVNIGSKVKKLALGMEHTCALLQTGDVKCWGNNGRTYQNCYVKCENEKWHAGSCHTVTVCNESTDLFGSLGLGTITIIGDDEHPVSAPNVEIGGNAIDISATTRGTCAVLENNSLRCWGRHNYGELGYGNRDIIGDDELPTARDVIDVGFEVKSFVGGDYISCAISTDDELKCWGLNNYGQLGQGNTSSIGLFLAPATIGPIQLGKKVRQVSVGSYSTCTILENNDVKCFGSNIRGYIGLGYADTLGDDELPISIPNINLNGNSPTANIEFADVAYHAPVTVVFNAMASTPSEDNGSIAGYQWNFAGQNTSSDAVTNYTFTKEGTYQVRLIVTDDLGLVGVARRDITILPEPKPTAVIAASSTSGNSSLRVEFNGAGSLPSEGADLITSYEWDFGNGQVSSLATPEVVYTNSGVYTAKLTVTDSLNRTHSKTQTISVFDSLPPVANFSFDIDSYVAPATAQFNAELSTPGSFDGNIALYEWDFGGLGSAVGANPSFVFNESGVVNVTLKVTDDRGKTAQKTIPLEVFSEPTPVAKIIQNTDSGYRPLTVTFDGSDSTASNVTGEIVSYNWNFGNGQTATGPNPNFTFTDQGLFTITLEIVDDLGRSASTQAQVNVLPVNPPLADFFIESETQYPHVPVDITLDASGSDAGGSAIVSYLWNMGDGTTKTGVNISHRYSNPGSYEILLTVENSDGEKSTKAIERIYYPALLVNVTSKYTTQFTGHGVRFDALVKDHDARDVNYRVAWISSDPSVLEIQSNGLAQTKTPGTVTVTAKVENNSSLPYQFEVKEKTANPTLLIDDDYFAKTFEQKIQGGVFGLTTSPYVSATYSPFEKVSVYSDGFFNQVFSLLPGVSSTTLESFDAEILAGQTTRQIRFFDGHGKSLLFDGVDDQAIMKLGGNDTNATKFNISLWTRLSDVFLAGNILDLNDRNGLGLKVEFDFRKTPIISIDQTDQKVYLVGSKLITDEWTHLSINVDTEANKVQLLQNGKIVSENSLYQPLSWKGSVLHGSLGGSTFSGLIDEVQIYHSSLSESVAKTLVFDGAIAGISPVVKFSFDERPTQTYFGNLNSQITLGIGNGYDQEDPSLRFSSVVLGKKMFTMQDGGLLSLNSTRSSLDPLRNLSFEMAPFVLEKDTEITIELLDAKTPGYLPKGISQTEYLLRLHPVSAKSFKFPGTLNLPIQAEKVKDFGSINMFYYKKSVGAVYRVRAINVNTSEQVASFPILNFGTYFSSYDSSFLPDIIYDGTNISDGAFDYNFDRRIDAKYKFSGTGPFTIELTGSSDGANLYHASCNDGIVSHNRDFPVSLQGLTSGNNFCYFYFNKTLDDQTKLYIKHLINVQIEN